MSSLFQTYFNSFKRINTWGIDLGCSGIGEAENKNNISFILPITSILIEIEIDKYIESKRECSRPTVNFYKNGRKLFSIELLVGGNWFISAFWSNDERFIAITETDQGADHTTIVDLQNRKIIKTYGGYEENSSNLWGGGYGSRAIVFNGSNAIFLPTLSYESEYSHYKYFDCENLVENIIVDFKNVAYNNLIIEDFCVIKNILIVLTRKYLSGNLFTGKAATCVNQKLRFININSLMRNNEIEEYLLQNDNLTKKLLNAEVEKLYANNAKLVILWNQQLNEVELDFTENKVVALTKPKTLEGNWDIGYYIDELTLYSKINDDGSFNTIRTEIGELLYQFKYRSNKALATTISKIVVENCEKLFCSYGLGLVKDYSDNIDVIIPIPPSNLNRPFQPVFELVQIISELSGIPSNLQYLKKKPTPALKSVDDIQERKKILVNAFSVVDKRFKGKTVLLFDDLYRSGETLNAAAKVLKEQGEVENIFVLTITKTRTKKGLSKSNIQSTTANTISFNAEIDYSVFNTSKEIVYGKVEKIVSDISELKIEGTVSEDEQTIGFIDDISFINKLENLNRVYLSHNHITDISYLTTLPKIEILDLGDNEIQNLINLSKLKNLKELHLYHNKLGSINALAELRNIEILSLAYNKINNINVLANFSNLKWLSLCGNPISDISSLFSIPSLEVVTLSHTSVSENDIKKLSEKGIETRWYWYEFWR